MSEMRLQKYMAQCGIASRRECEKIIESGRVKLNGKTITSQGTLIDPYKGDCVTVDNKILSVIEDKIYIMFYKPSGVVTTAKDQFGRKCVNDYFEELTARIFPVGRLDYDTEGLLIMTNDGDFMYKMTHPKHEIEKVYIAKVEGTPNEEAIKKMSGSINIEGKQTRGANIAVVEPSTLKITIHEGKNHQVKRICDFGGHPVIKLKRISIGELALDLDKPGQWRYITPTEVKNLTKEDKN